MKSYVLLENIKIYAYHGVFEQEKKVGHNFVVHVKMEVDNLKAAETDTLEHTVSYADVFDIVQQEMQIPSKLLEHVAWRIIRCLRQTYNNIISIEIKLSKLSPPLGGNVESAGVVLVG